MVSLSLSVTAWVYRGTQPVASRYTDWAIAAHYKCVEEFDKRKKKKVSSITAVSDVIYYLDGKNVGL
jgi:hypothetical protein